MNTACNGTSTTTGSRVSSACLLVSIFTTVFYTGHSEGVDCSIGKGVYIHAIGTNISLVVSSSTSFRRSAIIIQLLISQLGNAVNVIGNNANAGTHGAGLGAVPIAHQIYNIGIISRRNIHSTGGGYLILIFSATIILLFGYPFHLFARSKANIVIHKGFGVRFAAHVGHHARQAQLAGLGASNADTDIQNIIFRSNIYRTSVNIYAVHNLHPAIIVGILHAHSAAKAIFSIS